MAKAVMDDISLDLDDEVTRALKILQIYYYCGAVNSCTCRVSGIGLWSLV